MKKILIEYIAYLSYLYKLPKNIGKKEIDLEREYKIAQRSYRIIKCSATARRKLHLPNNSYSVRPMLALKDRTIGESAFKGEDIIGIEVNLNELENIKVPYSCIYEFQSLTTKGSYYIRNVDDMFLMKVLEPYELDSLISKNLNYYNKFINGPRYVKEINEDNTLTLTVLHDQNKNGESYVACDEEYPEVLSSIVSHLKMIGENKFEETNLPERAKCTHQIRRKKK